MTHVELPDGILNDLEDMTVSCWVYVDAYNGDYTRVWDFGSGYDQNNIYMAANSQGTGYTTQMAVQNPYDAKYIAKNESLKEAAWVLTTMTFDGTTDTMTVYENGVQVGTPTVMPGDLSTLTDSTQNWIGYGQWHNPMFSGKIADFRIYDYAMTADEVNDLVGISDADRVAADKSALDLGNTAGVTADLNLPTKGSNGSTITWASDKQEVVANDGSVTRPAVGAADAKVTLTATIQYGEASDTKSFTVTVLAQKEFQKGMVLHYDFESLKTGTIVNDISGNGKGGEVMPRGSGVETKEVNIFGEDYTAIVFNGGQPSKGHNYVEMPVGALNGLDSMTVSCWVYLDSNVGYSRIWDFGSDTTS